MRVRVGLDESRPTRTASRGRARPRGVYWYESYNNNRVARRRSHKGWRASLREDPSEKTCAAAALRAAVRISPPLAGREDILKRLVPTPFRGCGVRPPPLATVPARRVPPEAVGSRAVFSDESVSHSACPSGQTTEKEPQAILITC